jgi:hypothetical protein
LLSGHFVGDFSGCFRVHCTTIHSDFVGDFSGCFQVHCATIHSDYVGVFSGQHRLLLSFMRRAWLLTINA